MYPALGQNGGGWGVRVMGAADPENNRQTIFTTRRRALPPGELLWADLRMRREGRKHGGEAERKGLESTEGQFV